MAELLTIWCNAELHRALPMLEKGVRAHRLLMSAQRVGNLGVSEPDPLLEQADVAFGQPSPEQIMALPRLSWVQLTTAGYTRYDREDLRTAFRERSAAVTSSSAVYAEPCAQHVLAMMLAFNRQLPQAMGNQWTNRGWPADELRIGSQVLSGQTVLLVGYGSIGARLTELLAPFRANVIGVRRSVRGDEAVRCVGLEALDGLLPSADHIVNLLPASGATGMLFNADRLALMKPTAHFYNIGRGSTVDQAALRTMLETRRIAGAYLDVMMPEPLPAGDPLWSAPNCLITPHTAGGQAKEFERLVEHFLANLRRFTSGTPLLDRVI